MRTVLPWLFLIKNTDSFQKFFGENPFSVDFSDELEFQEDSSFLNNDTSFTLDDSELDIDYESGRTRPTKIKINESKKERLLRENTGIIKILNKMHDIKGDIILKGRPTLRSLSVNAYKWQKKAAKIMDEYGCWCNYGENFHLSGGEPVDEYDKLCRDLKLSCDCVGVDEGDECVPLILGVEMVTIFFRIENGVRKRNNLHVFQISHLPWPQPFPKANSIRLSY